MAQALESVLGKVTGITGEIQKIKDETAKIAIENQRRQGIITQQEANKRTRQRVLEQRALFAIDDPNARRAAEIELQRRRDVKALGGVKGSEFTAQQINALAREQTAALGDFNFGNSTSDIVITTLLADIAQTLRRNQGQAR